MLSISDKHKAIFYHIHKTGGTYIKFILEHYYDFNCFLTNINLKKKHISIIEKFQKERYLTIEKTQVDINELIDVKTNFFKLIIMNKMTGNLGTIINLQDISLEKWQTYFKFTFVRNPYDKVISSYEFYKQKKFDNKINQAILKPECTFTEFYTNFLKYDTDLFIHTHAYESQYNMIKNTINDIQIDYVAKYENINEEIINILKKIGIPKYTKHLHLIDEQYKTNTSKKNKITTYFTEESLETINILFHDDFEHFGYTKFYNIDELNNYLEQIKEKEDIINKHLLYLYNYQPKIVTDEDVINELFIHELLNEM